MQFLLDNIIAVAITLTLAVLLVSTQVRRQGESVDIANHRHSAGRTASIASTLRRDVGSLAAVEAVSDTSFDFTVALDPTATPVLMGAVRYRRRTRADGRFALVRRDETGAESVVAPAVDDWQVTLLDASDAPTTTPADARRVRIRMATSPAFAQAADTLDVVWEHVFSPPLLGTPSY